MADTNKKEYTSNLHPKGDMDTTVYPNVKSENIIDKDTTAYTAGKVPDSSLVSKSLDGISENLETTKIQVEANKTNIATLQGDVSTLKGNYSSVQSQANKNSSDIALLESNAIKKDTDASLKSLTLPSVSDLKTKDGTTFSGGSKLYNGTEYLPTFDIATLKDTYVDLASDQTIVGTKTWENNTTQNIGNIVIGKTKDDKPRNLIQLSKDFYFKAFPEYDFSSRYFMKLGDTSLSIETGGFAYLGLNHHLVVTFATPSMIEFKARSGNFNFSITDKNAKINNSPIVTQETLDTDLAAKQSTLYRHTVLISEPNNKTAYLTFTAESEKNTPIDSIQKLITVFGNTSISCSGIYRDGDPANSQSLLMINVGTSISDTTISSATIENNAITDFSNALFTDTFGSTGFTITDNVTAM